MRRTRLFLIFALWLLPLGVALAAEAETPAGHWFLEGEERGIHFQAIYDRTPNGKFVVTIRTVKGCQIDRQWEETGTWVFKGGLLINHTETVAGERVQGVKEELNDKFRVTVIDRDHQEWLDLETKIPWHPRRVPQGFKFPVSSDCAA